MLRDGFTVITIFGIAMLLAEVSFRSFLVF